VVTAEEVLELPEIPGAASFFDFAPPPAAERAGQSSFNLHRELL
jgi:hypothetical protein